MRDDDDHGPRRPATHVIGEALEALSVDELGERIALMAREIERLEAARAGKKAAADAAGSIFNL